MSAQTAAPARVHATTVAIGEAGILIRGASGVGKSSLALALIELAQRRGGFARLVADDRTEIAARHGRLTARPVPPLEGLVERRGLGLTPEPYLAGVVLRLVVDIADGEPPRMPEAEDLVETVAGIALPRLKVARRSGSGSAILVLAALTLFTTAG